MKIAMSFAVLLTTASTLAFASDFGADVQMLLASKSKELLGVDTPLPKKDFAQQSKSPPTYCTSLEA